MPRRAHRGATGGASQPGAAGALAGSLGLAAPPLFPLLKFFPLKVLGPEVPVEAPALPPALPFPPPPALLSSVACAEASFPLPDLPEAAVIAPALPDVSFADFVGFATGAPVVGPGLALWHSLALCPMPPHELQVPVKFCLGIGIEVASGDTCAGRAWMTEVTTGAFTSRLPSLPDTGS